MMIKFKDFWRLKILPKGEAVEMIRIKIKGQIHIKAENNFFKFCLPYAYHYHI